MRFVPGDDVLLQKIKIGDEKSFRAIYLKYHKQLYSLSLKYLRNKERAEDAVHDIFIKLWDNRKKLDTTGSLRGFLFTSLRNHVLNIIARDKRKLKKDIEFTYEKRKETGNRENVVVLSEHQQSYRAAIDKLPEKRREIFDLRVNEGLTNREVASYLCISIHTVKSQYYKALKFIRKSMSMDDDTSKTGT